MIHSRTPWLRRARGSSCNVSSTTLKLCPQWSQTNQGRSKVIFPQIVVTVRGRQLFAVVRSPQLGQDWCQCADGGCRSLVLHTSTSSSSPGRASRTVSSTCFSRVASDSSLCCLAKARRAVPRFSNCAIIVAGSDSVNGSFLSLPSVAELPTASVFFATSLSQQPQC